METKKRKSTRARYKQSDVDVVYEFSKKAYKEFGDFIKSIVLFGSTGRNSATEKSDIDILVVVDDATYKITDEIATSYKQIMNEIINEVSDKIHATTLKLTSLWEYLMKADPVIINILREGLAILDSGLFEPLQMLLYSGKIRPSAESIYSYIERAPLALRNSKGRIFQSIVDIYWATIDAGHAALMALGYVPPVPSKMPETIKRALETKEFSQEDYQFVKRVVSLYEKLKRNELKSFSGAELDALVEEAEGFIERMAEIIDKHVS